MTTLTVLFIQGPCTNVFKQVSKHIESHENDLKSGSRPILLTDQILIFLFRRCQFSINSNIFFHLELQIALAIPTSNEQKRLASMALVNRTGVKRNKHLKEIPSG